MSEAELHAKTTFRTKRGFLSATSLLTKIYFRKERVLKEQIDKGKKCSENQILNINLILFFIDEVFVKYYNEISPFLYIVTNCCHKTNAYFCTPPSGTGPWVFGFYILPQHCLSLTRHHKMTRFPPDQFYPQLPYSIDILLYNLT